VDAGTGSGDEKDVDGAEARQSERQ
jgi:hypothetical protein